MKKLFFSLMMMVLSILSVSAAELTGQQLKLRSDIVSFLRREGYSPEIDSDGDISFKKEGESYYITVSATDIDPYYVTINKIYSLTDADDALKLAYLSNKVANYKAVKLEVYKKSFIVSIEMFMVDLKHFTGTFDKHIRVLSGVTSSLADWINKMDEF